MARRTRIGLALAAVAVALTLPASGAQAADPAVSNQLIVGFKSGVSSSSQQSLLSNAGGKFKRRFTGVRGGSIRPRSRVALSVLRRRLLASSKVKFVEPDALMQISATPNDPMFPEQYGFQNISAEQAWDGKQSCAKVAVLDTGTYYTHPDLEGNVWHNSGEIKDNGKDDDKNGWVDDYYGVNIVKGKGSGKDDNGHGTHVSGIVGARTNNGLGVAGVCWKASIIPVKFMDSDGKGSTSDAITGIDYAVKRGAKIINCSFGTNSNPQSLQNEIDYAKDKGVLIVVAAGNNGRNIDNIPEFPASDTSGNILTVAATNQRDQLTGFSNYGINSVDLGAPGDNILSTYPSSTYKDLDGTSMAAPYVAGAAGLLRAANSDASYKDIKSAIRDHVDVVPSLEGRVKSNGRLNLLNALLAIRD